mgnify:CR=1 FL=1
MGIHNFLYHIWNYLFYQIRSIMRNSEKLLKTLSSLIENGILTSKDIKKELSTDLKFKRDKIINKLELVSREEFEVLKKVVQKQESILKKLSKKKLKR